VRGIVAGLPSLLILPFGWVTIASRPLESWLLILLRYWMEPKLYTWQSPLLKTRHTTARAVAKKNSKEG
jgi:hypothetical protein